MRTYYEGPTYTVEFAEADTACFVRYTDADPKEVVGHGSFVFDSVSGDLVKAKGAAAGRQESMEWLAFSQDVQDYARAELGRHGVHVNPYDFACDMPELSDPSKAKKHEGVKPEIGRTVVMRNPGGCITPVKRGEEGRIANIDDEGAIHVEWEGGHSTVLAEDDDWTMPAAWTTENPAQISRTRGVKTMKGPYSERKGYKGWIQRRGKLGEGFLTTMTKAQRHTSLDRCWKSYGYRSCLGSILALERAKKGPRGKGVGVGVKYASELKESRLYLKKKYGGPGAYEREEEKEPARKAAQTGPGYHAGNPWAQEHKRRAHSYLKDGQDALQRSMGHYRRAEAGGLERATVGQEIASACAYARDGHRFSLLALHEIDDSRIEASEAKHFREASDQLKSAAMAILNKLKCTWTG